MVARERRERGAVTKIYLLRAVTGSYSDRSEWTVRAYSSEDRANEARTAAEACIADALEARRAEEMRRRALGVSGLWAAYVGDLRMSADQAARARAADPTLVTDHDDGSASFGFLYDLPEYSVEPVDLV